MPATAETNDIRAVVFDFFGTLTCAMRRGPAHERVARGLGCDVAAFDRALDDTFVARAVGALGDPFETLAAVAVRAGASRPGTLALRQANADRIAAVRADIRLRPDAVTVLTALRRSGLRTAVVSDCTDELPLIWPDLPVSTLVDARVFSIEERRHKPDRALYRAAAGRIGVDEAHCLYVGDGGGHELTGAEAAGMTVRRLAADDLGAHLVFGADEWRGPVVHTLTDVADLVDADRAVHLLVA
ncbi:MAG TPA: HAD family hydrolase [Micromonosporaceae bacterium]|jgi:putative hydrolase of the HAD superfamily